MLCFEIFNIQRVNIHSCIREKIFIKISDVDNIFFGLPTDDPESEVLPLPGSVINLAHVGPRILLRDMSQ